MFLVNFMMSIFQIASPADNPNLAELKLLLPHSMLSVGRLLLIESSPLSPARPPTNGTILFRTTAVSRDEDKESIRVDEIKC